MNPINETITESKVETPERDLYLATEVRYEGAFACDALGCGLYSETQLRDWADRIGAELVLVKRDEPTS